VLVVRGVGEPDVAVAVAGQVEAGRLFAVGDPSAFINLMMRYPGTGGWRPGWSSTWSPASGPADRAVVCSSA